MILTEQATRMKFATGTDPVFYFLIIVLTDVAFPSCNNVSAFAASYH